jgi:hypothetical protein
MWFEGVEKKPEENKDFNKPQTLILKGISELQYKSSESSVEFWEKKCKIQWHSLIIY